MTSWPVDRRAFLAAVLQTVATAPLAPAQTVPRAARIGFLSASSPADPRTKGFVEALRQGLRELGWVEGQNLVIEYRWADDRTERLAALADGLSKLRLDVVVVATTPAIQAAKIAMRTVPIVMANAGDAVATGFVASLSRPGGNITGLSMMVADLVGKQLQILNEIVPRLSRVAILWNPGNPSNGPQLAHVQDAARMLGIQVQPIEARASDAIEPAFAAMSREHAQALIVLVDSTLVADRVRIAALAARGRLPAMYGLTDHVRAGGLMAYGANVADLYRRAATYVDKILRGARPADLPVEQPTTFELVINRKTATALGLAIPLSLLQRADQVIE